MTSPEDNKIDEVKEIVQVDASQESPEQINWKKFREEREQNRRAQLEAEARAIKSQQEAAALKQAMEALLSKPDSQSSQQYEQSDDDTIQKKIDAALNKLRQKDQEERQKREIAELPQKLKQTFTDFDKICSSENLDYLEYHYPEVAKAFQHMPEGFDKWATVYNSVKRFIPNTKPQVDEKKIEKNLSKPQAMSSGVGGQTSDSAPHILDESRKKANQIRMQKVMRGL